MKLSYSLLTAAALMVGLSNSAVAADLISIPNVTVTGNVGMTSNYKFRGEDQTSANPATQGGLTFTHKGGAYLSLWGSGVTFGGGTEIDALLGYSTAAAGGTLDVGVMRYIYADSDNRNGCTKCDFNELYASLTYGSALTKGDSFKVSTAYSPEYFNEQGKFYRLGLDYSLPVSSAFNLIASVGYNELSGQDLNHTDYKVGGNFAINGVTAELAYVGGDGSYADATGQVVDGKPVFTVSKSF